MTDHCIPSDTPRRWVPRGLASPSVGSPEGGDGPDGRLPDGRLPGPKAVRPWDRGARTVLQANPPGVRRVSPQEAGPPALQGGRGPPLLSRGSCPRRYCSVECLCSRPRARPAVVIVPAQRGVPILLSMDSSPSSVPAPTPPCPRRFERRDGGSNPIILISSSVIDRTSKN